MCSQYMANAVHRRFAGKKYQMHELARPVLIHAVFFP